jgi:hypothetical protein
MTPAMAAGVTDRLYEVGDLVALLEATERGGQSRVKMIDFAIQLGGAAIFVVLIFDWLLPLPNRIAPLLLCAYLFVVGVWAYAYPPGVLGWVKRQNAQVKPEDRERIVGSEVDRGNVHHLVGSHCRRPHLFFKVAHYQLFQQLDFLGE